MNIIAQIEQEQIESSGKTPPAFFNVGDTVSVSCRVREGSTSRVQNFEGVVIAKRRKDLNASFIVRKISSGEGVERTFQYYSPIVEAVKVIRRGRVRRAKLYYLRSRRGKSARIRERLDTKRTAQKG